MNKEQHRLRPTGWRAITCQIRGPNLYKKPCLHLFFLNLVYTLVLTIPIPSKYHSRDLSGAVEGKSSPPRRRGAPRLPPREEAEWGEEGAVVGGGICPAARCCSGRPAGHRRRSTAPPATTADAWPREREVLERTSEKRKRREMGDGKGKGKDVPVGPTTSTCTVEQEAYEVLHLRKRGTAKISGAL